MGETSSICLNADDTTRYLALDNVENSDGITSTYTQIGPNLNKNNNEQKYVVYISVWGTSDEQVGFIDFEIKKGEGVENPTQKDKTEEKIGNHEKIDQTKNLEDEEKT